jgi:hypothetical protein
MLAEAIEHVRVCGSMNGADTASATAKLAWLDTNDAHIDALIREADATDRAEAASLAEAVPHSDADAGSAAAVEPPGPDENATRAAIEAIRALIAGMSTGEWQTNDGNSNMFKVQCESALKACNEDSVAIDSVATEILMILNKGPDEAADTMADQFDETQSIALAYNATYEAAIGMLNSSHWDALSIAKAATKKAAVSDAVSDTIKKHLPIAASLRVLQDADSATLTIRMFTDIYNAVQKPAPRHFYGALVRVIHSHWEVLVRNNKSFMKTSVRKALKKVENSSYTQIVTYNKSFGQAWTLLENTTDVSAHAKLIIAAVTAYSESGNTEGDTHAIPTRAAYQMVSQLNEDEQYVGYKMKGELERKYIAAFNVIAPSDSVEFGSRRRAARSRHAYAMSPSTAV